jgi:hypothetical protein
VTTETATVALLHLGSASPEVRAEVGPVLLHALGLGGRRLPELSLEDFQLMAALGLIPNPPEEG